MVKKLTPLYGTIQKYESKIDLFSGQKAFQKGLFRVSHLYIEGRLISICEAKTAFDLDFMDFLFADRSYSTKHEGCSQIGGSSHKQ